jgi:hypothetical protein
MRSDGETLRGAEDSGTEADGQEEKAAGLEDSPGTVAVASWRQPGFPKT